ncbi:ParB/Srx family N-terminal domain-containing protein [Priestia koreensis]|uniref:ParB/Srx family N-terminal domain-containing protein n=1 Tax=Priestia koreensis TaxID=284581 RepID=UPI003018FA63
MKFITIPLNKIELENVFRNNLEDLHLSKSIQQDSQTEPLVVEKRDEHTFILVEGYRRFWALKHSNVEVAFCKVESLSSPESRVVKRLRTELQKKKKTGYELERMISFLLDGQYTVEQIATQCQVAQTTIKKYIKSLDVNPVWKSRAEKTGAGRHGLTEIHKLKNIHPDNHKYLANLYIELEINADGVDRVKKLTKLDSFSEMSKDSQRKCILAALSHEKFDDDKAKDIVFTKELKKKYSPLIHEHVFNLTIQLLDKAISNCSKNLVTHLSSNQRNILQSKLKTLTSKLGFSINWSNLASDDYSSSMRQQNSPDHRVLIQINKKTSKN